MFIDEVTTDFALSLLPPDQRAVLDCMIVWLHVCVDVLMHVY